jgi:AcrR family transcriptional regulator
MVSSAVYRYVASRDDLLTRLIVDAYDSLGAAAESSERAVDRGDLAGRFGAVCSAVRTWALANPNEYALIYGSPVPGYVAPADTVGPATRVSDLLIHIMTDAAASGRVAPAVAQDAVPAAARSALEPIRSYLPVAAPDALVQLGIMVWMALFGTVSFEIFGQLHTVIGDEPAQREAFYAECVRRWAAQAGIG